MRRIYVAVVAVTVVAHFLYVIYVPSGGFLALRRPRTILLHVATVLYGVATVRLHLPCPLTEAERWARARAAMRPLPPTGFIDRYITGVLYPANATRVAQEFGFSIAYLSWILFAARLGRRRGRPPG